MKVILTEDIAELGSQGEIIEVKDGYGRNYLIPTGKALPASRGNLAKLKDGLRLKETRLKKDKHQAQEAAQRLRNVSCTIRVQADENDKLYGSVGARDISQALLDQSIELDPHHIVLEEPIKMLGVYPVVIELFKDVTSEIKVWVVRE